MHRNHITGMPMVFIGALWVTITNHGTRSSKLGLIAGGLLMLAGAVRVFRARRDQTPPAA